MLTEKEKQWLRLRKSTKTKTDSELNSIRQASLKARRKALKDLQSLKFLAKEYPESLSSDLLAGVVETFLNQEAFVLTREDHTTNRQTTKSSGTRRKHMVKIGNPRDASGAPIDKAVEVSIPFCCKILGAINKSINTFDSHGPVVIAAGPNGQVAATMYTTLRFWLEKKDDTKRRASSDDCWMLWHY